ncbi:MAG: AI-2E family transporter [Candidatus Acidiferrum sp.]
MSEHNSKTKHRAGLVFLFGLTAVALYLCFVLVAPFLKPILFSALMAILFYPFHSHILRWIRNRNASALLSTSLVILFIALSTVFLGRSIVTGLRDIYQSLGSPSDGSERLSIYFIQLFDRAVELVSRYLPISTSDLRTATVSQAEKGVAVLINMTASALGSITALFVNTLIAFFILFFFLRDGRTMLRRAAVLLPLNADQARRLFARVKDTLNAIVYGTLTMAALQGALTGVAFWILGVTSPVLWAIVTTLCALLPIFGTAIVLLPAISMLVFSGHWMKGLILLVWAMIIVHPVDNLLRPYLIGGRTKLSTLYVFFALVGGLKVFGALGIFIGPIVLAITLALFGFLREEKRADNWGFDRDTSQSSSA